MRDMSEPHWYGGRHWGFDLRRSELVVTVVNRRRGDPQLAGTDGGTPSPAPRGPGERC